MADIATPPTALPPPSSTMIASPPTPSRMAAAGMKIQPPPMPSSIETLRNRLANTAVFSPVNQNGSFDFDRVIKSGNILKRTKKTKNWRSIHIVLRPNVISLYKDKEETKLRHQISLSELTAVARQKDPKGKVQHVFGVFSPSRNFHFAANTEKEAQEWVELIRNEARIDEEEEEEMVLMSPGGMDRDTFRAYEQQLVDSRKDGVVSSSSEAEFGQRPTSAVATASMHSARRPSHALAYSGNEYGSLSDFSDTGLQGGVRGSAVSLSAANNVEGEKINDPDRPKVERHGSQLSGLNIDQVGERVVCHGWLYVLKSKGGVRQWKRLWAVLRPKTFALYKNEEEYSASLVISFPAIINAVEIDPISKSRRYCMQIITEERNYRFCAVDDDSLAKWLGALKSLLAKRKEAEREKEKPTGPTPSQNPTSR